MTIFGQKAALSTTPITDVEREQLLAEQYARVQAISDSWGIVDGNLPDDLPRLVYEELAALGDKIDAIKQAPNR